MSKTELLEHIKYAAMDIDKEYQENPNKTYTAEEVLDILEELICLGEN